MTTTSDPEPNLPLVLVVMGVSGTGKSTIAKQLARELGWDLAEGDDLHPTSNVTKMAAGVPLTDEDRSPWLSQIADWIQSQINSGRPGIITCSALKRTYRDRMRGPGVVFVHLAGTAEQIGARMAKREDHFMPVSLLQSQLATLEPLEPDEVGIVTPFGGATSEVAAEILNRLNLLEA